jgi:hypothetical protein
MACPIALTDRVSYAKAQAMTPRRNVVSVRQCAELRLDNKIPVVRLGEIYGQWHIEDGEGGWYVVRPYGDGRCGPFTEGEAFREMSRLRAEYPERP